jgi:hypothetical protein
MLHRRWPIGASPSRANDAGVPRVCFGRVGDDDEREAEPGHGLGGAALDDWYVGHASSPMASGAAPFEPGTPIRQAELPPRAGPSYHLLTTACRKRQGCRVERNAGRFDTFAALGIRSQRPNIRIRVVCDVRGNPLCGCWYPQGAPHDPRAYGKNANHSRHDK